MLDKKKLNKEPLPDIQIKGPFNKELMLGNPWLEYRTNRFEFGFSIIPIVWHFGGDLRTPSFCHKIDKS